MRKGFLYIFILGIFVTLSCKGDTATSSSGTTGTPSATNSNTGDRMAGIDFEGKTGIEYGGSMPRVDNVNANMFKELVKSGKYVLLDVRADNLFHEGHIEGAVSFPYTDPKFKDNLKKLKKDAAYLICSEKGVNSVKAMVDMKDAGITHVINLIGGIKNWKEGYKYPLVK